MTIDAADVFKRVGIRVCIGDTNWALMFQTNRGSSYLRDQTTGLWKRNKYDGTMISPMLYFGSISVKKLPSTHSSGERYDKFVLADMLRGGRVPGFVPHFELDFVPIGIKGCTYHEVSKIDVGEVKLKHTKRLNFDLIHVGHPISWVCEEADMTYESPGVFRRLLDRFK